MLLSCLFDLLTISTQLPFSTMLLSALIVGLLIGSLLGFWIVKFAAGNKRRQVEAQLQTYRDELSNSYDNTHYGYHALDGNGNFIQVNNTELNWLGYKREDLVGQKTFFDLLLPAGQQVFGQSFADLKQQGLDQALELELIRADGSLLPVLLTSTAYQDASGHFIMSRSIMFDMTKYQQTTLEALRNQDLRQIFFNESADAIFLVDAETLLTLDCNPRAVELYEAEDRQDLINIEGHQLQRHPFTPEELEDIVTEMMETGKWNRELEYVTCKGNIFWGNIAAKQISVAGKRINLIRITDVTARRQAEEQVRISLQEKELLLKEVHHRVKNNLHTISNLLDLQTEGIEDERLLSLFNDSQNRIQAMALIHEQLYESQNLGKVEFGEYIERLISNLSLSYGNQIRPIRPIVEAESIWINLETAIPCGLLLNELVTNAFKHAFPEGRSGTVRVQLYQDETQCLNLKIWDDGVGLPPSINWQNSSSLGLKLVRILAKQLKASLVLDCSQGTFVHLTFSELKYKPRF